MLVVQLAFGVFGALAITSEHTTGIIRTTFAAAPRRRAVLAARAAVTGAPASPRGSPFLCRFLRRAAGAVWQTLDVTLADPGVLRAVAGAGFYLSS